MADFSASRTGSANPTRADIHQDAHRSMDHWNFGIQQEVFRDTVLVWTM
jgi:hypothetical protein